MLSRSLHHLRGNLIAYLALFVALGGTSYAALNLPANSVGPRQIRNHSIDAVKFNPRSVAASIQAWAIVQVSQERALVVASSSRVRVRAVPQSGESITWQHRRFGRNCMASVSPQTSASSPAGGLVTANFEPDQGYLFLQGFGLDKSPQPLPVDVMIVCP